MAAANKVLHEALILHECRAALGEGFSLGKQPSAYDVVRAAVLKYAGASLEAWSPGVLVMTGAAEQRPLKELGPIQEHNEAVNIF
jgi:hypothetical protein